MLVNSILRIAQRRLLPACLYSRLAGLLLSKHQGVSTGRALVLHRGHLGRRRGFHHTDDAAWPRHRALSRPADRDSQPRGMGCLARSVGVSANDSKTATPWEA